MRITKDKSKKESLSVTINRLMKVRQIIAQQKVDYTCELIDKFIEQDKKVIVFTNFTSTLDMIHEKYKKNSVILDGRMSKQKRQDSVDRFQTEKKIKIFISNIIAGGVGITLTAAEGVIMNDLSFVPAHHSQAEDRAYRYGQKNSVLVYYPIFENTIEKIIYNMLQKKKNIIDQVMGDGEFSESFTSELLNQII
jgi:SNF2 family DNA or RNA helicase